MPGNHVVGEPKYFSKDWCGLRWTGWIALDAPTLAFQGLPTSPGVYRVRPVGLSQLAYIGQTKRGLRQRLRSLAIHTYRPEMPYNDPHTAAPSLWILRVEEGMTFECSGARTTLDGPERRALEDMLLWKHRVECGESTLCNHGRFHRLYFRSRDRKTGRRGGKLPPGQTNPASGPSKRPLLSQGKPDDDDWMGLPWSAPQRLKTADLRSVPLSKGLYKILDRGTHRLLYVGETKSLRDRLRAHAAKPWGDYEPVVSYHLLDGEILDHQRREMETDLIGSYYDAFRKPPVFQYGEIKV
jgi:hypothetical protein